MALQFDRAVLTRNTYVLSERLAECFAASLAACLDFDLQRPTEAQLRYAATIARELNVPISGAALRYQGTMAEFIKHYTDVFKSRRMRRSRHGEALNSPPDD